MKLTVMWLVLCFKFFLGKRRFLAIFPPQITNQKVYDKVGKTLLNIAIRDADDWIQLEHIFLNEEYCLVGTGRVREIEMLRNSIVNSGSSPLILDLGANIGLASKYFGYSYSGSTVLAIEPDKGNCGVAQKNILSGSRLYQAAVSCESGNGSLINIGRNVAFRVERESVGALTFVTVPDVLKDVTDCVPFLIKIDIEGFESDLFSKNTDWIDLFPIMLIELHDWMLPQKLVTANFLREIAKRDREFMHFNGYVASISKNLSKFEQ